MPFVVGVVERAGVRFAAPGDAEVLVVESRVGVPVAGFLAVVEDMAVVFGDVLCAACVAVLVAVFKCWLLGRLILGVVATADAKRRFGQPYQVGTAPPIMYTVVVSDSELL